jgi:hypothetical protein
VSFSFLALPNLSDSTTWVHKADLDGDGKVTEADYVLFKLQQMQKVDRDMLDRLIDRFEDLDLGGDVRDLGGDVSQHGVEIAMPWPIQ